MAFFAQISGVFALGLLGKKQVAGLIIRGFAKIL